MALASRTSFLGLGSPDLGSKSGQHRTNHSVCNDDAAAICCNSRRNRPVSREAIDSSSNGRYMASAAMVDK